MKRLKAVGGMLALVLVMSACGSSNDDGDGMSTAPPTTSAPSTLSAEDLRTKVNVLLADHMTLAAKSTGAALGGREAEFTAYANQLNINGTDLGELVGAAYGDAAENQFNTIWSAHNGFFVDYTNGVATKNEEAKTKAVNDLTNIYVVDFSKFISDAIGADLQTVSDLTTMHVLMTKDVVDAQAGGNWEDIVAKEKLAVAHMQQLADPLAAGIAAKFPAMFSSEGAKSGADLRVSLDLALQNHMYLASSATGAALGGRDAEFAAYGAALNTNGTDLGAAIGSVYGQDAQNQFNSIWSAHNGFFVDYTTGVATKDQAAQDKAVSDLTNIYVPEFSNLISTASGLPLDTVTSLISMHVTMTKDVVDAQGAQDWNRVAELDRMSAMHMQSIGDPLAAAIVAQFPDKFSA